MWRIRGVSEDGENLANDFVPQLEKQFQNLGITLKENDDTFLSTIDIMRQLNSVWDDITDMQRADLLESVAGKFFAPLYSNIQV